MRSVVAVGLVCLGVASVSAQGLSGKGQYPQYRGASGLPGSFFGLTYDGKPSMDGAMAIATPIGFSLSNYHLAFGASNLSKDSQIRWIGINKDGEASSGTGQIMMGFSTGFGNITVSDMIDSNLGDNVINLLWQAPLKKEGLGVALGVQDLLERGGSAGVNQPGDHDNRRTVFAVATYRVQKGTHVSLGYGNNRFEGLFGNISHNITPRLKVMGEYDTFNWNYGISWNVGPLLPGDNEYEVLEKPERRRGDIFVSLGIVREKKINWGITVTY
jgi:hypothetical protein